MAITTLDGAESGRTQTLTIVKAITPTLVVGRPQSLYYLNGFPRAASAPSGGAAGTALTSIAGQVPFLNPPSGNAYLAYSEFTVHRSNPIYIFDRLWHNSGLSVTSTTAQTVNSVAWPARDATGTSDGHEVFIGVEVVTATGAGTPTLTMSYTNQDGTAGRTGTNIVATAASSSIGAFYPMGLNAGDTGVRSIQSFTLSATWTSGAISLVAYRLIGWIPQYGFLAGNGRIDPITGGFTRLYNNTVPFLIMHTWTGTTACTTSGKITFAIG